MVELVIYAMLQRPTPLTDTGTYIAQTPLPKVTPHHHQFPLSNHNESHSSLREYAVVPFVLPRGQGVSNYRRKQV